MAVVFQGHSPASGSGIHTGPGVEYGTGATGTTASWYARGSWLPTRRVPHEKTEVGCLVNFQQH
jgi:hypothetical protein